MRVLCLVAILGACASPNPDFCDATTPCADGRYCDLDGAVAGTKNACIDVSCTPSAFAQCDGDTALTCTASGDGYAPSACTSGCSPTDGCHECTPSTDSCVPAGLQHCDAAGHIASTDACTLACVDGATPHCGYISPRYLPDICDSPATPPTLDVVNSGSFDTDLDANCTGGVVAQTGASELCVVHDVQIHIENSAELSIIGTRALALVADDDLAIDGVLHINGRVATPGPGADPTASGGSGDASTAGGGAGFHSAGGPAGNATTTGGAANGGAQLADPATLAVLMGGPSGGGVINVHVNDPGGGGGGAATLVSCTGEVSVTGTLDAGGGGGPGGKAGAYPFGRPAGGGGAGGYFVLQGAAIRVVGSAYANGGGGGGGATSAGLGLDGHNGTLSNAAGGAGGAGYGTAGTGGDGGYGNHAPGDGIAPGDANGTAGGGGGSVGFLQTYTPDGVTPTLTPAHQSPVFQPNGTIPTR
ncbi:MAG TPA: hypothetical protein VGM88_14100 [Kofleriaceae bacterium]|jgi:hypothetical protein